jgi:carbon monoxide dehydrogenase subunit G
VARGSVRREVRIKRPADEIWAIVGDPARVEEWFTGIDSSTVDGTTRVVTTGSGLQMAEEIVTHDSILRRFQYRITAGVFKEHLSTIDVIDLGDGTSLVMYAADADPAAMALIIAGAAGSALIELRDRMEQMEQAH